MTSIFPAESGTSDSQRRPLLTGALAFAVSNMAAELLAPARPGETLTDFKARRAAAADVLDELLYEAAEVVAGKDGGDTITKPCPRCKGDGQRYYQGRGNGDYFLADCDRCDGTGLDGGDR